MSSTVFTRLRAAPAATERLLAVLEATASFMMSTARAMKNRRAVARLLELDHHMLADIGVTRSDVHSALAGGMTDDPSERLSGFARERRYADRSRAHEKRLWRR